MKYNIMIYVGKVKDFTLDKCIVCDRIKTKESDFKCKESITNQK